MKPVPSMGHLAMCVVTMGQRILKLLSGWRRTEDLGRAHISGAGEISIESLIEAT